MPPKAARALEWTKGFNNASPTERIEFLQRVEKLDENERPKINSVAAKKLFEYMIKVSVCTLAVAGARGRAPCTSSRCARIATGGPEGDRRGREKRQVPERGQLSPGPQHHV
jgi:hypothetical protein